VEEETRGGGDEERRRRGDQGEGEAEGENIFKDEKEMIALEWRWME